MADYTRPETCPQCGSIFVDWDRYHKVYRCLVKSCGWTGEHRNAHLKNSPTKTQISVSPANSGRLNRRFQSA